MSAERCERCDLPRATADDWMRYVGGEGEHLCWADVASPCAGPRVDWRARALAAEAALAADTPDMAVSRGRLAGLAEAVRIVRAEASRLRAPRDDTQAEAIVRTRQVAALERAAGMLRRAGEFVSATKEGA